MVRHRLDSNGNRPGDCKLQHKMLMSFRAILRIGIKISTLNGSIKFSRDLYDFFSIYYLLAKILGLRPLPLVHSFTEK